MCESAEVRFVHYMQHPEYPDVLGVGCVCAERMEEDYTRPRERERRLKNVARRRAAWRGREWHRSAKGNPYVNVNGFNLTLYEAARGWRVSVANRATGASQKGKKLFPDLAAAQAAAFEALIWAEQNLP
ncbi:hypothetical protein [Enterovirga aerilata]|nr:hypothetical protein [Enterovirga sp. DB1703]